MKLVSPNVFLAAFMQRGLLGLRTQGTVIFCGTPVSNDQYFVPTEKQTDEGKRLLMLSINLFMLIEKFCLVSETLLETFSVIFVFHKKFQVLYSVLRI